MPLTARPVTPAAGASRSASRKVSPWLRAWTSRRPTVESPMPRLGTLRTRLTLTSSAGLAAAFR